MQQGLQSEMLPYLFGDKRFLHQVLFNLVSNAIKFSQRAGTIKIAAQYDDDHMKVEVSDEGDGFDPDQINLFFGNNIQPLQKQTPLCHGLKVS